jgi:hypothetical protein
MPQSPREGYEAKRAERNRKLEERAPKPWHWFGQRDAVARFTLYLGFLTLALVVVGFLQWSIIRDQLNEMRSGGVDTRKLAAAAALLKGISTHRSDG